VRENMPAGPSAAHSTHRFEAAGNTRTGTLGPRARDRKRCTQRLAGRRRQRHAPPPRFPIISVAGLPCPSLGARPSTCCAPSGSCWRSQGTRAPRPPLLPCFQWHGRCTRCRMRAPSSSASSCLREGPLVAQAPSEGAIEVRFRSRCRGAASREPPARQSSLTSTGRSPPITRAEAIATRTAS